MTYGPHYHSWDYTLQGDDISDWFNYHPRLAQELKESGLDIVSTANNHAFDTCAAGVDDTITSLDTGGIKHFGTVRQGDKNAQWWEVTETRVQSHDGVKQTYTIAWVACTASINGDQKAEQTHVYRKQVMLCDSSEFYSTISYLDSQR